MDISSDHLYAVISGDIVDSSRFHGEERERLYEWMKRGGEELRGFLGEAMPLNLDIYAGDGWQVLLADPKKALWAAVFFRAFIQSQLKGLDTRLAVATGTVDLASPPPRKGVGRRRPSVSSLGQVPHGSAGRATDGFHLSRPDVQWTLGR
jgi:hypothetical protein